MNVSRDNSVRVGIITVAIGVITFFHYTTQQEDALLHVLFRELYFLPIILAGFYFGLKGGLISAGTVTVLYFPYILIHNEGFSNHDLGNFLQIILFMGIGGIIGLLRDRERALEDQRIKSESLTAMGKAVSYIAHDMKTPLIAVGGFVTQVRRKITDSNLINKLDYASEQIQRLEVLIGDMLAFAKPLELNLKPGKINQLIEEVIIIASEKAAQHSVTVTPILEGNTPIAKYDHQRLHQALVNLVNNAIEACPSGSEVTLRCRNQMDYIIIEIADQGCGIPEDICNDIFTPFVSTKKEGTGLGLPIVKKIIDAHDGSVGITENSENGVTFFITIPVKVGTIRKNRQV